MSPDTDRSKIEIPSGEELEFTYDLGDKFRIDIDKDQ